MGKFTKTRRDSIVRKLKAGNWAKTAVESSGITEATYYAWIKKGDAALAKPTEERTKEEREFANFRERVTEAEAYFEEKAVELITLHAQAAQGGKEMRWLLERRFPSRWGPKERLDITSGGEPIRMVEVVRTVSDSEAEEEEDDDE